MTQELNILLTCIGRRVALLQEFRRAMADLGLKGRLIGTDTSALAPGFHVADEGLPVPEVSDPRYVDVLLGICRTRHIGMVVPQIDWELPALAAARERFAAIGTHMIVSSPRVVNIGRDKLETYKFLTKNGFDTPRILSYTQALKGPFPLFIKPRYGSSAKDVHVVEDRRSLVYYHRVCRESLIQEYVEGIEFTVDVYAGLDGVAELAVPRQRLEVRGGEVAKAKTVRHPEIINQSLRLVELLRECIGVVTLQCFLTPDHKIKFIEMNPRFGGGVPLAIKAGADFPRWLIEEHLGRKADIRREAWQDGLLMLRYDAAVFRHIRDLPEWGRPEKVTR